MTIGRRADGVYLCALAALTMAYGWGYRGVVGHEGGAAVPGAMLGVAICLGSGRADWYRRAAVAALFGAAGWAWGGSVSYMEQTMYSVSDSFPDVLYGYAMLFLIGALWAGIGGAILGLAFTLPRSHLNRFAGPFIAVCAAFLITYLVFFFNHAWKDVFERFTAEHMHDGDWFAALTVVIVCSVYAFFRPNERAEALLFVAGGVAWYVGYMGLTWFGGLAIAPPYRSESWSGVLGILVILLVYLYRAENRAALMMALYGTVGGGLAFALAVFVRHPIRVEWGPFASWGGATHWKIAEESFGLMMGLAIALAALRLIRGGLATAQEDVPREPLDFFAGFAVLVALMWMNLRRVPMAWMHRYQTISSEPMAGLFAWQWFVIVGLILTALALYGFYLYRCRRLAVVPPTSYGQGALMLLLLLWLTMLAAFMQDLPVAPHGLSLVDLSFLGLVVLVTAMVLRRRSAVANGSSAGALASDHRWRVGKGYAAAWLCVPLVLLLITSASMAMQDGAAPGARLRFGAHAYWREAAQIRGTWEVMGRAEGVGGEPVPEPSVKARTIRFRKNREIVVTNRDGSMDSQSHIWMHADSLVWLGWYGRVEDHAQQARVPIRLENERMYIPWPPDAAADNFIVLERQSGG